jgi:hypothetical protein
MEEIAVLQPLAIAQASNQFGESLCPFAQLIRPSEHKPQRNEVRTGDVSDRGEVQVQRF